MLPLAELKGYGGLGSKFLNGGQTYTINAENVTDHYCHRRLGQFMIEKKCKPLQQSTKLALRSSYAVTLNPCKARITVTQNRQFVGNREKKFIHKIRHKFPS